MGSTAVNAPSVYASLPGAVHAVRFGDIVYTSAILPRDAGGRVVAADDVVEQAKLVFTHLRAVLASAGARSEHVARLNCYIDPGACRHLARVLDVRDGLLAPGAMAGTVVPLELPEEGALIAIEAIAHVDAVPEPVVADAGAHPRQRWAEAVRVSDRLYVSGRFGAGESFAGQAKGIYDAFDAVVKAAGASWHDVVRVRQFAIGPHLAIDEIRAARAPYLRNEEFLSTSVVCHAADLAGAPASWQLIVDIEAALSPKRYSSSPSAWANPGGLHIVTSDHTGYFQAQMSRNREGKTLHADDVEAHTDQCCRNLDAMMREAAIAWSDVVHARVFCKHRSQVPVARGVVDGWLNGNACARTELVADFWDPLARVEIELTANV